MEEWDLQAIVRGRNSLETLGTPKSFLVEQGSLLSPNSPDIFPNKSICWDELGDLCKPFHPTAQPTLVTTSIRVPDDAKDSQRSLISKVINDHYNIDTAAQGNKLRKSKKNEQKIEVKQVTADGLLSDTWAWRKYGQKPIKGSLYPRSYYRCSSSKGCLARKQVERSPLNPDIFIVTYANEHNHERPTRRNSLAGSNRNKTIGPKLTAAKNESRDESIGCFGACSTVLPVEEFEANANTDQIIRDFGCANGNDLSVDTILSSETTLAFFGNIDELIMSPYVCFDGCF